ncbi:MAG: hypothetical protein BM557_04865 [Flavobacterium sp. MedPE-SWcel]|uniref:hypothetical protein n=1 Tax=uncultured Flavobacterium sp. TaxID=165435 RepID=UPI0009241BB5|nr:hypothetical protein [uncultured Flavobacterium sp.]OIQ21091.1 MAG: hypothetical protein BM557_04865 [Flavobacterium sp. MedPE-SWcel]
MTFIEGVQYLGDLSPVFLTVGVITGAFLYKNLNKSHKIIFYYLLAMLVSDVAGRVLINYYESNRIFLLLYSLVELILFMYLYLKIFLSKGNKLLAVIGGLSICYIIGEILYYFVLNNTNALVFQPYSKVVDNFFIILLSLTFLYEKMSSYKESRWDNFRLNIVVLVFFTLNTIIYLPFNFLVNETTGVKFYFWGCHILFLLIFYGFLTSEIWRNGKIRK